MTSKEPWKELHAYWQSKHRDDRPPARGDLDPLIEITSLVPNLMLLDLEDGTYRYRLVGTEVAKRSGIDMTGQLIGLTITEPGMRDQWRAALDTVRDGQKPQLFLSLMPPGVTARYVTIMLPLVGRSGKTEMILAGVFFDGYLPPGKRVPGLSPLDFGDESIT
jgi:hypothetical protein